jgi:hypothetical protein
MATVVAPIARSHTPAEAARVPLQFVADAARP